MTFGEQGGEAGEGIEADAGPCLGLGFLPRGLQYRLSAGCSTASASSSVI